MAYMIRALCPSVAWLRKLVPQFIPPYWEHQLESWAYPLSKSQSILQHSVSDYMLRTNAKPWPHQWFTLEGQNQVYMNYLYFSPDECFPAINGHQRPLLLIKSKWNFPLDSLLALCISPWKRRSAEIWHSSNWFLPFLESICVSF